MERIIVPGKTDDEAKACVNVFNSHGLLYRFTVSDAGVGLWKLEVVIMHMAGPDDSYWNTRLCDMPSISPPNFDVQKVLLMTVLSICYELDSDRRVVLDNINACAHWRQALTSYLNP